MQILRRNTVEGRELSAEAMVAATEGTGALDRQDIRCLLDHTQKGIIALRIRADFAELTGREKAAHWAGNDFQMRLSQRIGQDQGLGLLVLQEPDRHPLGAAGADAGQPLQLRHQSFYREGKISAGHCAGLRELKIRRPPAGRGLTHNTSRKIPTKARR